jgi:aromatic-L-amino-acid decarboxylase
LWLPLKLVGAAAFTAALDEKLDLAQHAHRALCELPEVQIVAAPQLSLLVFRHVPGRLRGDEAALDAHNQRLLAAINRRNRVYLTSTVLGGRFVLRICVLSFRTHRDRVDAGLADIAAAIAELS